VNKPKLLATHPLFEGPRQRLAESFEAEFWTAPERPPRAEFLRRAMDKDALVCLLTEKIDEELLAAAPNLRIVANVAVGFDNIDLEACTRHKVAATNTPGVLDETTADFAWTLLLAVARRLLEGDALARSGQWQGWNLDQLCGADVWGKTLAIFGLGRIGQAVARRAQGFGMRILYHDAKRAPQEIEQRLNAEYVTSDIALAQADFLTLHVPLLPETRHLIGANELAKMKRTAFLINTSRGPVVSETALIAALENKLIAGSTGRLRARAQNRRRPAPPKRRACAAPGFGLGRNTHQDGHDGRRKCHRAVRGTPPAQPPQSGSARRRRTSREKIMTLVTRNTPKLTLAGAKAVLAAAEKRSAEIAVPMDIAIVDDGGHLLAFSRMDGAKLSSIDIAIGKALGSALRRLPTGPVRAGDQINLIVSLGLAIGSHGKQTPIRGGVPLLVDGICVGAVGTSNGTEDQDLDVAQAGAKALETA
jgi:glyoxylate reductase